MIISDTAVRHRTTVFVLVLVILIAGLFSYVSLPLESAPDVAFPNVLVQTFYRGVSPEDMEQSVTIEIENKLKGLEGVKEIRSVSAEGVSSINIEFTTDTDIDDALIKVKDKVDLAKPELPTDLDDEPQVFEVNFSEFPILVLSLTSKGSVRDLTRIAEDLEEAIEGIDGVLEVDVVGGVTREIHVEVDPQRMALYGIPFTELQNVIAGENANVSGGSIRTSQGRYQLRVPGEFETVDEVESIVISMRDGPVYLRDVAKVIDGIKDPESYSRTNGENSVTLYVKKRSGENIVSIVDAVDELVEQERGAWPPGVSLIRVDDRAREIHNMLADLENNILSGLLLVIVVVMLAMGFRNALLVSLSIPLSMLIAFIVLKMMGITLNMVVLFSLTLALGMLVDNAIVIIENIYRFMQQGVPRAEAAMRATSEVAWPIIGSSLTTIFAFVPMLFWDGIMGGFMVFLPKTVIITLASCLFVALIINPALAAVLMRPHKSADGKTSTADDVMAGGEHPMLEGGGVILTTYRNLLHTALRFRLAVVAVAAMAVVVTALLWALRTGIEKPMEFFPTVDPNNVWISIKPPEGADLDHIDQIVREVACRVYSDSEHPQVGQDAEQRPTYEECLHPQEKKRYSTGEIYTTYSKLPGVEFVYEKASTEKELSLFGGGSPTQVGLKFVDLADRFDEEGNPTPSSQVVSRLEELVRDVPGAEIRVEKENAGPPVGAPINVEIVGENFVTLGRLAEQVKQIVEQVPHTRNVRSNFEQGSPTLELVVDRKRAAVLGLSTQMIGFAIKAAINGIEVSTYREGDEDYDILVRFLEEDRRNIDTLRQIFLPSPTHGLVPLTTVADIHYTGGVGQITRINHNRVVTVSAEIDEAQTTGPVARAEAERLLAGVTAFGPQDVLDAKAIAAALSQPEAPALAIVADALGTEQAERLQEQAQQIAASDEVTDADRAAVATALNQLLEKPELYRRERFPEAKVSPEIVAVLEAAPETLPQRDLRRLNRVLLESVFPGALRKSPSTVDFPPGYRYSFTGENEDQQESQEFLSWAMMVALVLILFTLVAQFDSITKPLIIMSSVALSLGGVFLGLAIHNMPFGLIMTGVGVISLAGVVVNNAIVLVDYTQQLIDRGLPMRDAIIAAGATRLRPVLLTAITTVLGLIPMLTGIGIDFQPLKRGAMPQMQWVSESSQFWASMAAAVIWGLAFATMLTLVVVPVLFSLTESFVRFVKNWRLQALIADVLAGPALAGLLLNLGAGEIAAFVFMLSLFLIPVCLLISRLGLGWAVYPVVYEWWNHFDKKHGTAYAPPWARKAALERYGETPPPEKPVHTV